MTSHATDPAGPDRTAHLMMLALDDEASPDERAELDATLAAATAAGDPEPAAEWARLKKLKEVTQMTTWTHPQDAVWSEYRTGVYNRLERGIAWILVSVGAITLMAWGAYNAARQLIEDPTVPGPIKLALGALALGGIILFVSVARERLFVRRHDPYKEIER